MIHDRNSQSIIDTQLSGLSFTVFINHIRTPVWVCGYLMLSEVSCVRSCGFWFKLITSVCSRSCSYRVVCTLLDEDTQEKNMEIDGK